MLFQSFQARLFESDVGNFGATENEGATVLTTLRAPWWPGFEARPSSWPPPHRDAEAAPRVRAATSGSIPAPPG